MPELPPEEVVVVASAVAPPAFPPPPPKKVVSVVRTFAKILQVKLGKTQTKPESQRPPTTQLHPDEPMEQPWP